MPLAAAVPAAAAAAPRGALSALGSAAVEADVRRWGRVGHRSSSSEEPRELRVAAALLGPRLRLLLVVLLTPVDPGTGLRTSRPGTGGAPGGLPLEVVPAVGVACCSLCSLCSRWAQALLALRSSATPSPVSSNGHEPPPRARLPAPSASWTLCSRISRCVRAPGAPEG